MAQNTVIGLDFTAWRLASQALDTNVPAMSQLFPSVEAGLIKALSTEIER
jgi:hypothetical protein